MLAQPHPATPHPAICPKCFPPARIDRAGMCVACGSKPHNRAPVNVRLEIQLARSEVRPRNFRNDDDDDL